MTIQCSGKSFPLTDDEKLKRQTQPADIDILLALLEDMQPRCHLQRKGAEDKTCENGIVAGKQKPGLQLTLGSKEKGGMLVFCSCSPFPQVHKHNPFSFPAYKMFFTDKEDLDDLRMEGVTTLVLSGSKFNQGRPTYPAEPQAKVTLNICSRCASWSFKMGSDRRKSGKDLNQGCWRKGSQQEEDEIPDVSGS
ncbi:hypothetical protein STEG23_014051, partial [Scotinomys teguina]